MAIFQQILSPCPWFQQDDRARYEKEASNETTAGFLEKSLVGSSWVVHLFKNMVYVRYVAGLKSKNVPQELSNI